MATTLATKNQSEAIRQRMAEIRTELPDDVDRARVRVQQLTDWKYHAAKHRVPVLIGAVALGYALIPGRRTDADVRRADRRQSLMGRDSQSRDDGLVPREQTLVGEMIGGATTLIVRQLTSVAIDRFSQWAHDWANEHSKQSETNTRRNEP